jgi:hypothetical protein
MEIQRFPGSATKQALVSSSAGRFRRLTYSTLEDLSLPPEVILNVPTLDYTFTI